MVNVKCHSKKIIHWLDKLSSLTEIHSQEANVLHECVHVMKRDWKVMISHIFREHNRVANSMDKLSYKHERELRVFKDPPILICSVIYNDLQSVLTARSFVVDHTQSYVASRVPPPPTLEKCYNLV